MHKTYIYIYIYGERDTHVIYTYVMCIHIYIYICIYVHTHTYIHTYTHTYKHVHTYILTYIIQSGYPNPRTAFSPLDPKTAASGSCDSPTHALTQNWDWVWLKLKHAPRRDGSLSSQAPQLHHPRLHGLSSSCSAVPLRTTAVGSSGLHSRGFSALR